MTSAEVFHGRAVQLSLDLKSAESALLELLIEMKRQGSFLELGYAGIFSYCEGALGLSPAQSNYFQKVAQKSEEVPELKQAIDSGKITLSQARRIVPVVTQENQIQWIEKAATLKQRELEKAVMEVNPDARLPKERIKPVAPHMSEVRFTITDEEEKELRLLQDLLSRRFKRPVSLKEALLSSTKEYLKKKDPVQKAIRVSSRKPRRKALPAAVKHAVNLRDKGQCSFEAHGRRCEERRWTDLHHKIPVSSGGSHEVKNLVTLCSAHHRFLHQTHECNDFTNET